MKVSVAIITRYRANDLKECLESLSYQAKQAYEVIVVDNGPSLETSGVVKEAKKFLPIKYVVESRVGVPYARNKALKVAKGEVIAFCDDDCILDKRWLEQIELAFRKKPRGQFLVGKSENYYPQNIFAQASFFFYKKWRRESVAFDTKNGAFEREPVLKSKIRFDNKFALFGCGEDVDFGEKLIEKGMKICYWPRMVVYHKEPNTFLRLLKSRFERGRLICFLKKVKKRNATLNKNVSGSYIKDNFLLLQTITKGWSIPKKVILFFCLVVGYLSKNFGYFFEALKER